jgi:hypothetical protein
LVLYDPYPQAGTDVNSANSETPLVIATRYGLTDCVKYLLKAGASKKPQLSAKKKPPNSRLSDAEAKSPDFKVKLGYERAALRRNRSYDGLPRLPNEGSPQMAFFDAAAEGDLSRLMGERALHRPKCDRARLRAAPSLQCGLASARVLGEWGSARACVPFAM